MQDWKSDPFLIGAAWTALSLAMQDEDWAMLSERVCDLRERGADVERLYEIARQDYPSAPPLQELAAQLR